MAGRQGLRKACTRLDKNKLIVMSVYQQHCPTRYLSTVAEAWAMRAKGNDFQCSWHKSWKKSMCAHKFLSQWVFASSETFFPVTCSKTQVGCERETGRDIIRNADTISIYVDYVWNLVTFNSALTNQIGIFITTYFQPRHHSAEKELHHSVIYNHENCWSLSRLIVKCEPYKQVCWMWD